MWSFTDPLMFWRISWSLERYLRNTLPQYINPSRILEFGPGRSTRVLAETFPDARITSLEHQEAYYSKQKASLQDLPQVTLHHCPLNADLFYSSGKWTEGSYDLLLVDGPPKNTKPRARAGASRIFDNIAANGIIILDDSHRPDEKAIINEWAADFDLSHVFTGGSFTVLRKGMITPVSKSLVYS